MRAITYDHFGPAAEVLRLDDLPTPEPGAGEVLVRLHRSGANPSDAKARAGSRPGVTEPPYPLIVPHSDGAGVIEAAGDGVSPARIGERVWIWNGQWQRAFGTAAEFIALPEAQAVPMPEGMEFDTGATLGIPGLTAAEAVLGGGPVAGKRLLISGGSGAVGHNALQLALWAGAEVIATCSAGNMERLRAAGAHHVMDYRDPALAENVLDATDGQGIDRAAETEFGVNAELLARVMAPHGVIAAYGSVLDMTPRIPFGAMMFKALTIDAVLIYMLPPDKRAAAIEVLHRAWADGAFRPLVHDVLPLADCARAHEVIEAGARSGTVLLDTA